MEKKMIENFYDKKTILITGGTGSLGKALIKRLKQYNCKIIVYSRDEGKQALSFGNDSSIIRVIGDVRDYKKLATVNQALNKTQSPKKQILIEKGLLSADE